MTTFRQILTTALVTLTVWVDPLVRQVSASTSVAGQVCDYTLQAEVCVGHRHQDQGNNNGSTSALFCDRLTGNIKVMVDQEMSILYVPELDFQWGGRQQQQQQPMVAGQLEFTAQGVGDNDIQFRSSKEIESGLGRDLMVGLGHLLLRVERRDSFPDCGPEVSADGLRSRRSCETISRSQTLFFIKKLETEKKYTYEDDILSELEVKESFSHFSNLDSRVGEEATTKLMLQKISCDNADDVVIKHTHVVEVAASLFSTLPMEEEGVLKGEVNRPGNLAGLLKEKDAIKLVVSLRQLLEEKDSETEVVEVLRQAKKATASSGQFVYVLEAAAATGSLSVFNAVLKVLKPGGKEDNSGLLERYLVALSLAPRLEDGILEAIQGVIKKYKKQQQIVETAFYCLCKQSSRNPLNKSEARRLVDLVGGLAGAGCTTPFCQRAAFLCIAALRSDAFTGDLLDAVSSSKDLKTAEVAAIVLGQPGVVTKPQDEATARSTIINLLANMKNTKRPLKTALLFKLLDILDLVSPSDDQEAIRKLMLKKGDKDSVERSAYLAQRILSASESSRTDYSLRSLAAQGESIYISERVPLDLTQGQGGAATPSPLGGFTFSTTMSGGVLTRTSFNLNFVDLSGQARSLMSIHSFIGGMSGMLGEEDPDDDKDANASLQISILGLPLRPVVLFSSVGDLLELYWSGAGQEEATLFEGTIPVVETRDEWVSALGLRVSLHAQLIIHLLSQGKGSVSIWESSGEGSLSTSIAIQGHSGMRVEGGEGSAHVTGRIRLDTAIQAQTKIAMDSTVAGCVLLSLEGMSLNVRLEARDLTSPVRQTIRLPGYTWNMNHKNNLVCSQLLSM